MQLRSKFLLLPAVSVLAAVAVAVPASSASTRQFGPMIHVPRFAASSQMPAVRPGIVTGSERDTYITTRGTDVGACQKTAPCATITYAESQTAVGGTINLADGTYNQSAELTQPVHLSGASQSKVIIDGTGIDYGMRGYFGLIAIDNTSGTGGTIAISDLTITHPFITAAEADLDQSPIDVANFDQQQAGDTVTITAVKFGPAQDEADFPGIGYYSLNAVSTTELESDTASGMNEAYFAEGSGGSTTFAGDTASKLAGDTSGDTYFPAVGVVALADTSASLAASVTHNSFTGYNGWGVIAEAGYAGGNCSADVCTGGLTLNADHNLFDLTAAPAASGVAAIAAYANQNDSLTGTFSDSSGEVARPDLPVSVVSDGGTTNVTDSANTINTIG
jgi:hypothetical protein